MLIDLFYAYFCKLFSRAETEDITVSLVKNFEQLIYNQYYNKEVTILSL